MKILLAEDARALAAVMAARLNSFGHDVLLAENGKVALDMFKQTAPDLVLMDIEMPVMNGFEAAMHIRAMEADQQWAWTPILFLTASDTPENLVTAIEAGGDDFLAKTAPENVLHAKMKAMARIAALRQRLAIANQKLQGLAFRDGLTGLFNRRHMDLETDRFWAEAQQQHQPFAILLLDIDNFKKYNDLYGHHAGDDCLRSVAEAIDRTIAAANASGLTQNAFAARYGGEEFLVVLPDTTAEPYQIVAQSILDAVRRLKIPHRDNVGWRIVTASVGGAWVREADGHLADLFRTADARLYQAKENGRNRAELDVQEAA